jgi:hypothetical protein
VVGSCGWHVGGACAQTRLPDATGRDRRSRRSVSELHHLTQAIERLGSCKTRSPALADPSSATAAASLVVLVLVRVKHPCVSWHSPSAVRTRRASSINARHPNHPFSDGDAFIGCALARLKPFRTPEFHLATSRWRQWNSPSMSCHRALRAKVL